jgi:hypothetical protein
LYPPASVVRDGDVSLSCRELCARTVFLTMQRFF